jgi:phospholipase A1
LNTSNSPGHRLALAFALALGLAGNAAHAQGLEALQACHTLADAAERLACYDRASGRDNSSEAAPGDIELASASEPSILEAAWQLNAESDPFPISMYHSNYILPFRYSNDPNKQPFSPVFDAAEIPDQRLDAAEAKFQISLKARLWSSDDRRWSIWGAYTQQNQWQVFNEEISRPFRETNYMPELFASYQPNLALGGFDVRLLNFGLTHQSNGRADPISRSWDRLFAEVGVERGQLAMMLRVWARISESEDEDDNPDITDYYGHTQLKALYRTGNHSLEFMARGNVGTGKGAVQLGWFTPKLVGPMRGYVQLFSGYGESMIDYNWNQTTIGVGLALNDGL